jgi:hypothetical protein
MHPHGVAAGRVPPKGGTASCEISFLKHLRWVRKLKTGRCQFPQYLIHHTGYPAAARRASDQSRNLTRHKSVVKDIDSARTTLRIFDNPFRRPSSSVGLDPRINNKMRDRQDPSCSGDLSNSGGNEPERRTKPTKRMARFTERVADCLITQFKIQPESFEIPQIGQPMVKCVIYQEMPGICNRTSLFRLGRNLATDQTEASFHAELIQDSQQVIGDLPCRAVVEGEYAVARCQRTLLARNKDKTDWHVLTRG